LACATSSAIVGARIVSIEPFYPVPVRHRGALVSPGKPNLNGDALRSHARKRDAKDLTVQVQLNPDPNGYHTLDCRWLEGGRRTDLDKYR
jgi:hypothetical protein